LACIGDGQVLPALPLVAKTENSLPSAAKVNGWSVWSSATVVNP
jgi:hypothetical protein